MSTRRSLFGYVQDGSPELPPPPTEPGASYPPWQSHWRIDAKRTVQVVAYKLDGTNEIVHAREWIETLNDRTRWPEGTAFELVMTEER